MDNATARANYERFKKQAKFKSEKQVMINAKMISVVFTEDNLIFEPFRAVLPKRTYLRIPEAIVKISDNVDPENIGKQTRLSWEKCSVSDAI